MTEPTDAEILELASQYWHCLDETESATEIELVRAALAKWGQPAQAGEPVAVVVPCYTPSGKRVALYSAKQDLPIGTQLYTAPQPVAREQLTEVQINAAGKKMAECMDYPWGHMPEQGRAEMRKHAQAVIEAAHGIKGGQHVE